MMNTALTAAVWLVDKAIDGCTKSKYTTRKHLARLQAARETLITLALDLANLD